MFASFGVLNSNDACIVRLGARRVIGRDDDFGLPQG
jgi:hypothetical protein